MKWDFWEARKQAWAMCVDGSISDADMEVYYDLLMWDCADRRAGITPPI